MAGLGTILLIIMGQFLCEFSQWKANAKSKCCWLWLPLHLIFFSFCVFVYSITYLVQYINPILIIYTYKLYNWITESTLVHQKCEDFSAVNGKVQKTTQFWDTVGLVVLAWCFGICCVKWLGRNLFFHLVICPTIVCVCVCGLLCIWAFWLLYKMGNKVRHDGLRNKSVGYMYTQVNFSLPIEKNWKNWKQ